MSDSSLRPSTVDGIKRLAKSRKRDLGISHSKALDLVASEAGYQNFRHARNALTSASEKSRISSNHISICVEWRDRTTSSFGSETLQVSLPVTLAEIVPVAKINSVVGFHDWYAEAPNTILKLTRADTQHTARSQACALAATLQFMAATGLQPSLGHSRISPILQKDNQTIPGLDHPSTWYDRTTKRYLLADEPYPDAAARHHRSRVEWAEKNGFVMVKPNWRGMYYPGVGTEIFLFSHKEKGVPLEAVVSALNKLPLPITPDTWKGVSGPYTGNQGLDSRRRRQRDYSVPGPIGKMPVAAHRKVGELLASVLSDTGHRRVVDSRIRRLREQLDTWAYFEHHESNAPEALLGLYRSSSYILDARSLPQERRQEHVRTLNEVKEILVKHYPRCESLRKQVGMLNAAIKSLQSWAS